MIKLSTSALKLLITIGIFFTIVCVVVIINQYLSNNDVSSLYILLGLVGLSSTLTFFENYFTNIERENLEFLKRKNNSISLLGAFLLILVGFYLSSLFFAITKNDFGETKTIIMFAISTIICALSIQSLIVIIKRKNKIENQNQK